MAPTKRHFHKTEAAAFGFLLNQFNFCRQTNLQAKLDLTKLKKKQNNKSYSVLNLKK